VRKSFSWAHEGVQASGGKPRPADISEPAQGTHVQAKPITEASVPAVSVPSVRETSHRSSDLKGLQAPSHGKNLSRHTPRKSRASENVCHDRQAPSAIPCPTSARAGDTSGESSARDQNVQPASPRQLLAGPIEELGSVPVVRRHAILYSSRLEIHRRPPNSDASSIAQDCVLFTDVREFRLTSLGFELHLKRGNVRRFNAPKADLQAWREAWGLAIAESGITQRSSSALAAHVRRHSTTSLSRKHTVEETPKKHSNLREASADVRADSGKRLIRSSSRQLGRSNSLGPAEFERSQPIHGTQSSAELSRRTAGRGRAGPSPDAGGIVRQHRCSSLERPRFR